MCALWLVNQLWVIVPVNPRKNSATVARGLRILCLSVLPTSHVVYQPLYNNQINAHALIGQSAVGYCAGKPTEKSCVFWIII